MERRARTLVATGLDMQLVLVWLRIQICRGMLLAATRVLRSTFLVGMRRRTNRITPTSAVSQVKADSRTRRDSRREMMVRVSGPGRR